MLPEACHKTCFYVKSADNPVAEKMEINTVLTSCFLVYLDPMTS